MLDSQSVKEKVRAIQIGILIAAPIIFIKKHTFQFTYECYKWWRTYILRQEDCDNCKYFGGCYCDHLDDNGNCLGWERADLNPIHKWQYQYKIKKFRTCLKTY